MSDELPAIVPPHSVGAEEAVLGAILIDLESIRKLTLQPEDFYKVRNGWIYRTCQDLIRQGKTPDVLTVCSHLNAAERLVEVGGQPYIIQLVTACPSYTNVEDYAAIVQERAYRRAVIETSNKLANCAFDLDSDMQAAIRAAMDKLSKAIVTSKGARPMADFISQVYDEVDEASQNPPEILGIPTGFIDWDKYGGLARQTVLKLSGDPGVGKSLLSKQVLINAAKRGYKGVLYQIEMTGKQSVRRTISGETGIPTDRMRMGKLTAEEWPIFVHAIEMLSSLGVFISDASDITTTDIRVDCQRIKEEYGLDIVVIDYEGLLEDPAPNELERQNLISKRIKAIAKDLDIAIITIGDMTKAGIQGTLKGMGAQGGTGRSQHDRDEIATLREDTSVENKCYLTWDKNREGGKRSIQLVRLPGLPMFADYAPAAEPPMTAPRQPPLPTALNVPDHLRVHDRRPHSR